MRLSAADRQAIETAAREVFPHGMRLVLFGSRVDDQRLGGDIDLLVEAPGALTADEQIAQRDRFVGRLYRLIDEQRIDVLMAHAGHDDDRAVVRAARDHGLELVRT